MTAHEFQILAYLKQNPDGFFARKEIARRAAENREEFEANPHWAAAPLNSLVSQGLVEMNDQGHYRVVPDR